MDDHTVSARDGDLTTKIFFLIFITETWRSLNQQLLQ